jgi:hypothetical protein
MTPNSAGACDSPEPEAPDFPPAWRRACEAVIGLLTGALFGGVVGGISLLVLASVLAGEAAIWLWILAFGAGAWLGGVYWGSYGLMHGPFVGPYLWVAAISPMPYAPEPAGRMRIARVVALACVLATAAYLWVNVQSPALPATAEVRSVAAQLDGHERPGKSLPAVPPFLVPGEHVPKVLAALGPTNRDWAPHNLKVMGQLIITGNDGEVTTVDLYWTHADSGAFSVDQASSRPFSLSRCFRGGSNEAVQDAIRQAYAALQGKRR